MATPRSTIQLLNRSLVRTHQIGDDISKKYINQLSLRRTMDLEINENHIGHYIVKNEMQDVWVYVGD